MPKILYLVEQPLDDRNYKRFGIQHWVDAGWSVEIWDFTKISFPHTWKELENSGRQSANFEGLQTVSSLKELGKKLRKSKSVQLYVDFTGWNLHTIYAKLRLKLMGAKLINLLNGNLPRVESKKKSKFIYQFYDFLHSIDFTFALKIFRTPFYKISKYFLKPDYIVVTGNNLFNLPKGNPSIIYAHDFDYDIYLELRSQLNMGNCVTIPRCVFLDQNLTSHTDFLGANSNYPVTSENYFKSMSNAFKGLTDQIKLPIYVAEHPRSVNRSNWHNVDGVKRGITAEIVKTSRAVICHYSTAVKFAVLFNKPILFFTTNELNASGHGQLIEQIAAELGKSAINIDNDLAEINWAAELNIDIDKYRSFSNNYIKFPGSPDMPLWKIVMNNVNFLS